MSSELYRLLLEWHGGHDKMLAHVRDAYERDGWLWFVSGCNYAILDKDLLGGTGDGERQRAFDDFVCERA